MAERQAIRTESSKILPKGNDLIWDRLETFKPKSSLGKSGDFGERASITLIRKPKVSQETKTYILIISVNVDAKMLTN